MQRMLNDLMPNTGPVAAQSNPSDVGRCMDLGVCRPDETGYKLLDRLLKEIDGDGADGKFTTPEFVDWFPSSENCQELSAMPL